MDKFKSFIVNHLIRMKTGSYIICIILGTLHAKESGAYSSVDLEFDQAYSSVVNSIPTLVSNAVGNSVEIQAVEFNGNNGEKHNLSTVERLNSKWVLKIDALWREKISCKKINCGDFLRRIIVHQLAHIFDETRTIKPMTIQEKKVLTFCSYAWEITKKTIPDACKILNGFKKSISDHPDFLSLLSPEQNAQEVFAEHFEKYVFDPDYECRYPGFYNFLVKRIGRLKVQNSKPCAVNYKIPQLKFSATDSNQLDLDPSRIYRIDYFLAEGGEEVFSKWGHTMFRLVVCSPARQKVSELCVNDTAFHIVVGFSALVTNGLNPMDGLTGKYSSILTVKPLNEFVKQYSIGEDRSLVAYPIKFAKSEINNFISHVIDAYWNHNKKYYFLGNNCATEGLSLVKRSIQRPYSSLFLVDLIVMTPNALLRHLRDTKFVDLRDPDHSTERHISYFPSTREIFLAKLSPEWKKFWQYPSAKLKQIYQNMPLAPNNKYTMAARFHTLERTRVMRLEQAYMSWIQAQIANSSDVELRTQGIFIKERYLELLSNLHLRKYPISEGQNIAGAIPLQSELKPLLISLEDAQKDIHESFDNLINNMKTTNQSVQSDFPKADEYKTAKENLAFYSKEIAEFLQSTK